jgi:hypothetical protein
MLQVKIYLNINIKTIPLNQGQKPQISPSLKQITDRIANMEGSILLKSQNNYHYPRLDKNVGF